MTFSQKYGPWAIVAGGSSGLGEAYARALAKRGLNLVLLARKKEPLEATANDIRLKNNVEVKTFAVDLADFESTKKIIENLDVTIGLLVYNAAYAPIGLFKDTGEDQLSTAAMVNVRTPLLLSRLLAGKMIENGRGGILLMSSLSGVQGSPRLAAYSATKAFNTTLAEALWKELKPHGIDVIACCAGAILTPGYQQAEKKKNAPGTLTADKVAEAALRALGRGPVIVPGGMNKFVRFLMGRLLPRKLAIYIMGKNTGGLS